MLIHGEGNIMYKLFIDKAELFECDIKIEGTSLSKSTARLVVETNDYSLMFNGKISSNGKLSQKILILYHGSLNLKLIQVKRLQLK